MVLPDRCHLSFLVRLPIDVNEIIYVRYVWQGHPEMEFMKMIWRIYFIRVPKTYKMQNDIRIFQSIDRNLNKTPGCHKLT